MFHIMCLDVTNLSRPLNFRAGFFSNYVLVKLHS